MQNFIEWIKKNKLVIVTVLGAISTLITTLMNEGVIKVVFGSISVGIIGILVVLIKDGFSDKVLDMMVALIKVIIDIIDNKKKKKTTNVDTEDNATILSATINKNVKDLSDEEIRDLLIKYMGE